MNAPKSLSAASLALLLAACGSSSAPREARFPDAHPNHHGHHGQGTLVHRFERAEEWVPFWDAPERDEWQRPAEVIEHMRFEAGMTVVDLGAGTGYFEPHLSRAVGSDGHVLALDVEPDLIRHMRERFERELLANVEARQVPFDDPQLAEGSVHRILTVNTWHHITNRPVYARKLALSLVPGGAVFVVDVTLESPHGPPRAHRLAPEAVIRELEEGGLQAEVIHEELPWQYIVVGRRPAS